MPCPVCGGKVQIRKTKANKPYYICENNTGIGKGCNYISWNKPQVGEKFDPNNVTPPAARKTTKTRKTSKKTTKKGTKSTRKKTTKKS